MRDIIIIGSGPAGLSAAIYGKRANLEVLVAEKDYEGMGQIAESGQVDNYLGIPGISGYDLGERFRSHAAEMGVEFLEAEVTALRPVNDSWQITLEDGEVISAKAVIYSAGASPRRLDIPGEEEYAGRGVSYCAICDGALYKNKTVAVVGGGDTALDEALYLSKLCGRVYLIHRRDEFRGAQRSAELVRETKNIELVLNAQPAAITGESRVSAVELSDGRTLAVSAVFAAIGSIPRTALLTGLVALDEHGYVIADEMGRTDRDGFFAAGDVRSKELRQIVTAVADGANAAAAAAAFLNHRKDLKEKRNEVQYIPVT